MKTTTTFLLMTLLTFLGLSQQTNSTSEIHIDEIEYYNEIISEVSKNEVSATMTAHTYKLNNNSDPNEQFIDSEQVTVDPTEIKNIIDKFLAIQGVSECTFDHATQTFTILSGTAVNLQTTIENINKN